MKPLSVLVNGVRISLRVAGEGPALLLLHGFTGSSASWEPLAPALAGMRQVVAVDLLGHGDSDAPADASRYSMERCLEDLLAVLDGLGAARADVLGYSMGGRVALHLAAAAPGRIGALVLESASPGLADPGERQDRIHRDEELAQQIERDGIEAFVDRWERLPLFASQRRLPPELLARQRSQRLNNRPQGLANSLRGMGTGAQAPLWERLGQLPMPVLLIAGELDEKFAAIAREMAAALPDARLRIVEGAGHNVHLEQPEVFLQLVREFLGAGSSLGRSGLDSLGKG